MTHSSTDLFCRPAPVAWTFNVPYVERQPKFPCGQRRATKDTFGHFDTPSECEGGIYREEFERADLEEMNTNQAAPLTNTTTEFDLQSQSGF